ncbi:hypothetical protein OIO90_001648 [Microbotryomycetes sp. JL221]|nr:hypothetical protein OIO90_001648 [Microbotryomycetes sp. JL221]
MPSNNNEDAAERQRLLDEDTEQQQQHDDTSSTSRTGAAHESSSSSLSNRLKQALQDPSKLNGLEKLFASLVIVLLLLTATFAGMFAGEKVALDRQRHRNVPSKPLPSTTQPAITLTTTATSSEPTSTRQPSKPGRNDQICTTSTCVRVAAEVINAMDTTVDPCDDFYHFANGNWLKTHPIPDGAGLYGIAQDIGVRNTRIILDIINSAPTSNFVESLSDADKTNLGHLRTFWDSCLDEDRIDRQGVEPLTDVVKQVVHLWRDQTLSYVEQDKSDFIQQTNDDLANVNLSKKWDPSTFKQRLTSTLAFLHSRSIPSLFQIYPEGNVGQDPKQLVAWLTQSELGLPSKDYYKDQDVLNVYEEVIKVVLNDVAKHLGDKIDANKLSRQLVKFETDIAKVLGEGAEGDPVDTYNPTNSTRLATMFPLVSFKDYFASFTPRPFYPDPVVVTDPTYLTNLTNIVENVEPDVLEAYFVFRTAQELGPLLGPKQPIRREIDQLNNYLGGISEGTRKPRRDICVESTLSNFGFLVGRYYVQQAFGGDSKEYAEAIIEATIQAFKDRLPDLHWLDEKTRKYAEVKASAITHKIGYPTVPDTMDPSSLERWYSLNLPIDVNDYLGNVLRSRVAEQKRSWSQIGRMRDERWEMIPSEVNAYYSPPANEIVFPSGILQSPYFSKDWPEFLAFGSFGSVAGHELSHAFDQAGRKYNKDGKLDDWWTPETTSKFQHLQQCIIDQYANYSVQDAQGRSFYVRSKITNGEDMADAGGIAQSFKAWKDRFERDPKGHKYENYLLPGLSQYSREQLFFVAYAQGWARNISPAEAVKRIRTDPHSPTNYRVIGPLSNSPEFSEAFGCKVGQRMSNKKKCHVW